MASFLTLFNNPLMIYTSFAGKRSFAMTCKCCHCEWNVVIASETKQSRHVVRNYIYFCTARSCKHVNYKQNFLTPRVDCFIRWKTLIRNDMQMLSLRVKCCHCEWNEQSRHVVRNYIYFCTARSCKHVNYKQNFLTPRVDCFIRWKTLIRNDMQMLSLRVKCCHCEWNEAIWACS